jgi:hypothetical protein
LFVCARKSLIWWSARPAIPSQRQRRKWNLRFASQADAEGELARANAELEEDKKKKSDLDSKNVDLDSKNDDLEIEILKLESDLARRHCVEHERDYKELDDLNNQERDERAQQDIELEFQNQLLKAIRWR